MGFESPFSRIWQLNGMGIDECFKPYKPLYFNVACNKPLTSLKNHTKKILEKSKKSFLVSLESKSLIRVKVPRKNYGTFRCPR